MSWLRIIRWPNLVMIALTQYLIRLAIVEPLAIPHRLDHWHYALGVLISVCLAAAGYLVNDLHDVEVDQRNKPGRVQLGHTIDENTAWWVYGLLNLVAVVGGYYLAGHVALEDLWLLPPVAAGLLYLYATDFKSRPVLGNFLVSLLTALPVALVAVYDILPAQPEGAAQIRAVQQAFQVVMAYALFAFWFNWIREMIKDAEDREGDAAEGYRTLAVILGVQRLRWIPWSMALLAWLLIGYYALGLWPNDKISALYLFLFVLAPLMYLIVVLPGSQSKGHFRRLSTLLKIIMLTGILSMVVFTLSLQAQL